MVAPVKPHLQTAEVGDLLEVMVDAVMALGNRVLATTVAALEAEMVLALTAQTAQKQLQPLTECHQKLPQLHHKLCFQNGSLRSVL